MIHPDGKVWGVMGIRATPAGQFTRLSLLVIRKLRLQASQWRRY